MNILRFVPVILFASFFAFPPVAARADDEMPGLEDQWDAILANHVRSGKIGDVPLNVVDYSAIAKDPRWPVLLETLAVSTEPADRGGRIAYWSNAYNILAIKVVLGKYPVKSIKDAGGWIKAVWDFDAGTAAGKTRTLSEIEHGILRPIGDARIHAAIVCASVSCPPLRNEAYRAAKLDEQLDDQVRVWLANEHTGLKVEDGGATIRISPIFDWFGEDFARDSGSVRAFVDKHRPKGSGPAPGARARIEYFDYDWSLNDSRRSSQGD